MSFVSKKAFSIVLAIIFLFLVSPVYAQDSKAEIGFLESAQVAPAEIIQVPVSVQNAKDMYALDITIEFDPSIIQVVDADPATSGIQIGLGNFLDPGLLLFNTVDNQQGTIHFAMSQYNPSEPKSGDGILLVINFTGIAEGESALTVTDLMCASMEGSEVPSQGINSSITVSPGAPTQDVTYTVVELTQIIVVNTLTPTPLPTATRPPTVTPMKQISTVKPSPTIASDATAESKTDSGYFLVDNWWIILILVFIVVATGIILFKKGKLNQKRE